MSYELRLYKHEIAPGAEAGFCSEPRTIAALYIVSGGLRMRSEAGECALGANSALHATRALTIRGGSLPTVALRWELGPAAAPGSAGVMLLAAPIALERGAQYLLRCDRVDFPPQGEALLHTHQGGGTRCLLFGGIDIETQGARHHYGPLGAWFEAGPDPVYAAASATEPSAFVRVMLLPRTLLGKSSIAYVNAADLTKPKSQRYQVFLDVPIELP